MSMQPFEQRLAEPAYRIFPENIPAELKAGNVWVCWVLEKVEGRITKVPYIPSSAGLHTKASSTNPQSWRSFDAALACAEKYACGIGRVFIGEDGIVGIDFDAKPELSLVAKGLMDMTSSYTEWSPSGKGAHTFARGTTPEWFNGARHGDIEMYRKGRFFTVTGNRINGHAAVLMDQPFIDAAFEVVASKSKRYDDVELPISPEEPPENWQEQMPENVLACYSGFDTITGDDSADDFIVAKELLRIHPDANWAIEVLKEGSIREDKEKYDRPSYYVPTMKRAWASLLAGFDVEEEKAEEPAAPSDFVSLYELMTGPEPEPIQFSIEQMQTTGLHIFGAAPKTGKTRFMLQASMTISVGGLLFGKFKTIKQKVLYYLLEDSQASLRNRLKQMNLTLPGPDDFMLKFTAPQGFAALRAEIKASGATYIVIDTAAMFEPTDDGKVNAYEKDKKMYRPLKTICDELGVTIVIITHTTKSTNDDNPFSEIQGSLGKQGMASGMAIMRRIPRDKHGRVRLHVHGRDINMEEWVLEPVGETPAWQLGDEAAAGSEGAQAIIECIRLNGESRITQIAEWTGLSRQWVSEVLKKLAESGRARCNRHRWNLTDVESVNPESTNWD